MVIYDVDVRLFQKKRVVHLDGCALIDRLATVVGGSIVIEGKMDTADKQTVLVA